MATNLSRELRAVMERRGLSATDLSRQSRLTHSLISRVLSGGNHISPARMRRLLAYFRKPASVNGEKDAALLVLAYIADVTHGIGADKLLWPTVRRIPKPVTS